MTAKAFIARWEASSGAERANFQMFLHELCDVLGTDRPDPASDRSANNDYTFERSVQFKEPDGSKSTGRIDLYKKGCFVLEAKQSRQVGRRKELVLASQPTLPTLDYDPRGKRSANRAWDQLMISARHQAQEYARALPTSHGWPPFVLVCDVAHCIEVYADFSGQGKNYAQFPDRQSYRIYMEDLLNESVCARLKLIWQNPVALDPARQSAKVTREIAARLAQVSKGLEARKHHPEEVALFLMRCLFTMFAEDVELLPRDSFKDLLSKCASDKTKFVPMVDQLWHAMDKGDFALAIEQQVKKFNGKLFKEAKVLPLEKHEIEELAAAAKYNWKEVEPAIFGTLLEQALDEKERARLGAHYTPRSYVERLVVVTIMEPLRHEWAQVQATAERLKEEKREKDAVAAVRGFYERLCSTRVLDPACGTGNFLYVSMELMKRLEGEVLEALLDLGGQEALALEGQTVDPHQFLGLELNPRAAAIAELVIWLGYLQWHFRTKGGPPAEPILREFRNITVTDALLTWDGWPKRKIESVRGEQVEAFPNARRSDWPEAEFIVGKDIRANLGNAYVEALWRVHNHINESADFVMYWWDRAAEILAKGRLTRRFGFVTTNSITQVFSRRVVAHHLEAKKPVSILMAIPDHPWTKATEKAAAVRIAMTVAAAGKHSGVLRTVLTESRLDTDQPQIDFGLEIGRINSDLTVGTDVTLTQALRANEGLSSPGVKLHGSGFIVTQAEAELLGLEKRPGLDRHIRPYRNGRDITGLSREVMVIDLFGYEADEVRKRFPEVYQRLVGSVKKARQRQFDRSPTRDAREYLERWWTFGKQREELRPALAELARFIATAETSKHRIFQFLGGSILPDNMVIAIASDDGFHLGVLSSRVHTTWAMRAGGWLGVGNDQRYSKSRCFDPFPFPQTTDDLKDKIRAVSEELDSHRRLQQKTHPQLTLTKMYNVLERLKSGEALSAEEEDIKEGGLVVVLKELHESLDALVLRAYGWLPTLTDEEILEKLVALNQKRATQERAGIILWLRPDYQIQRFGSDAERARLEEESRTAREERGLAATQGGLGLDDDLREMKPRYPTGDELAETAAVMHLLAAATGSLTVEEITRAFAQGRQIERRVASTIAALARLGHLATTDGGRNFVLRRSI